MMRWKKNNNSNKLRQIHFLFLLSFRLVSSRHSHKELVCVFPFLGKKSLEIKKRLQNTVERTSPYCKLKVVFKSPSKIGNHFHFKDVIPKKLCSGIVYSFKCNSCNAIYYGKTKRHFTSEQLNVWEFHI